MSNKTIYATPFLASTKETTGPSVDSGFKSIDEVVAMLGPHYLRIHQHGRTVTYDAGEDNRVIYSDFIFRVDEAATTG